MSSDQTESKLEANSSLGCRAGDTPTAIVDAKSLKIIEEPGLPILSLRRSRITADQDWLAGYLQSQGIEAPESPRQLIGDRNLACARMEPHCWLVTGAAQPVDAVGHGWFATDLSDRFCVLALSGIAAFEVLASGGNLQGLAPGMSGRMPFAESVNVLIQQFAPDEFRLLVDVSFGPFLAEWLADAANLQVPS